MSPTERRIVRFLSQRGTDLIGGYELRDAVTPRADVKVIHVLIHRLRNQGVPISSVRGPRGGYRLEAS